MKKVKYNCLGCGKECWHYESKVKKYCGRECIVYSKRESKREVVENVCPECGKPYSSYRSLNQTFCSRDCVLKMNKKYNGFVFRNSRYKSECIKK